MGLRAIYQKPRTTVPGSPSERSSCLVDIDKVTAIDQVWATDITYIPPRKGFLYLVAIVDLFSRNVLSWKLSNSLDTQFCMDALEMALASGSRQRSFISIRVVNSPLPTSWARCRQKTSRSAGLAEGGTTTTSWWKGLAERSSM